MSERPRGPLPGWRPTTDRQAGILADALARYRQHEREDTLPRGGRGIFYDLRPNGLGGGVTYRKPDSLHPIRPKPPSPKHPDGLPGFGPMEVYPEAVQEVVLLARRAGIIPERWVADSRAPAPLAEDYDEDAEEVAAGIVRWIESSAEQMLTLDPQLHQSQYVEMVCEAEDLGPRIERIAKPYGAPVYPTGGYGGLKGKRAAAARAAHRDVPTIVLQIGDLDPHGLRITRAAEEDSSAWVPYYGPGLSPGWLTFRRIAVTVEQAELHRLLDADGKAEADSLPVPVLDAIVTEALDELFDPACREQVQTDEDEQRRLLPEAIREALRDWLEGGPA